MASSFPGSLDTFVNPTGSDSLSAGPQGGVSHASMHSNIHDILAALEAKVGVNSSAVSSSLDYRVSMSERNAPVGAISMFAGSAAPPGWLLCQGQQVTFSQYPLLAAVFGVTGGTWNLPDLRQRVPLGSGTGYPLLGTGGQTQDEITLAVTNLPSHDHSIDHTHGVADHHHSVGAHGHGHTFTVSDSGHTHTITDPSHSHPESGRNEGQVNGGRYVQRMGVSGSNWDFYSGATVRMDSVQYPATASASTGITGTDSGSASVALTGAVSDQAAFDTSTKTGLVTDSQTGTTSGSVGDGTAFDVDVVQPYYVVNFIIRTDDI
jgi:microcystin-dependent protein